MTIQRDLLQDPGAIGYFHNFLLKAPWPAKAVLVFFFVLCLLIPFISGPEELGIHPAKTTVSASMLMMIYLLTLLAMVLYNRKLTGGERRTGALLLKISAAPLALYAMVLVLALLNNSSLSQIVNLTSTALTLLPVVLIILMLLQLILSRGRYRQVQVGGGYLVLAYFTAVFLVIFTFGTAYWLNAWFDPAGQVNVNFLDVLYMSGLDFSTLGFVSLVPRGPGMLLAIVEAVSSYFIMALMAASFLAVINDSHKQPREGED